MPATTSQELEFAGSEASASLRLPAVVKEQADRLDPASRLVFARAFCAEVVSHYWNRRLSAGFLAWEVRKPPAILALSGSETVLAARVAAEIARSASTGEAGHFLGALYTSLLPEDFRSRLGVYYTPPALVDRLIRNVTDAGFDWANGAVLDPSCGGAAFLAPVARKIAEVLQRKSVAASEIAAHVAERVRGIEIDPFAAWMAMVLVELELLDILAAARRRLPNLVSVGDALEVCPGDNGLFEQGSHPRFDLVIGNPPYGRVSLTPELRRKFGRSLYGHANSYGLFTDLALRFGAKNALVAFVTPPSFLGGQYFKRLRELLRKQAPPIAIDFVTIRTGVFDNVLQETVLVTLKKGAKSQHALAHSVTPNGAEAPIVVSEIGRVALPAHVDGAPWLFPRTARQRAALEKAWGMKRRLADYGLAVSTGQLVWNRHKEQLKSGPGANRVPLIWAESVSAQGEFAFRAAQRDHVPYFQLRHGQEHLLTRRACILVQRTTAKEQRRRLIAAVLPGSFLEDHPRGVVVENHLNIVKAIGENTKVPLPTVCALLNSRAADTLFRCINGSVAVSAYELNALPLPDPASLKRLNGLVARGAPATEIDACIDSLYGMMRP